jgi:hypothetical protein
VRGRCGDRGSRGGDAGVVSLEEEEEGARCGCAA